MDRLAPSHTLPAVFVLGVVEAAEALGASRAALLAASGLTASQLSAPETPIPVNAVFAVWEAAMHALRDPAFPIAYARRFSVESYPVLGFAVMTAPTGREVFARVLRYSAVVTTSGRLHTREEGGRFVVRWQRDGARTLGHRVANEAVLAELMTALRQTLGRDFRAEGVRFRHAAPFRTKEHTAFFGARPSWEAREDALVLSRDVLDAVPRFANLAMAAYFEKQAALRLREIRLVESFPETVARIVEACLVDGDPSVEKIARQLGRSERSLRRDLAAEGVAYRTIVDNVRRARADALLADASVSLAEVAFALGFSEHAAFSRAYKRWTGMSPADARRRRGRDALG
ncbi:MAG TPA: AraC family transcriptional regulator [Vicinamibacterales bacterium]|nr:AraC family transcriptional regulator [Vicinamibacterales bacterium]